MKFMNDNFMLKSETAKKLYHDFAEKCPIIDYHCHLDPKLIAEDYRFKNITDLLLSGDHYKWRAMRSNGVDERFITGDASDHDKFIKWAETLPYCIGNPLYHWNALEFSKYFGIDEPLCKENAEEIWEKCNALLASDGFSVKDLIRKSDVKVICTTDDPADDLKYHKQIKESGFETVVLPTFRPDKLLLISKDTFIPYLRQNGITNFAEVEKFIKERVEYFAANGCRISDHSLETVPFAIGDASAVLDKKLAGEKLSKLEEEIYMTAVLNICSKEYAKHDFAMQLHIGALRNNNTNMFKKLGADVGFDSMNDLCVAENLSRLLDMLECEDMLPKTIIYTLNPKDNYVLGTMMGNFQKAPHKSKIQFGAGWWFCDQRDGMVTQMRDFAALGLLSRFVGMLTDSRSFVSYTRHDYFRRILCDLIGTWVEDGEYPNDEKMLKEIIEGICFNNAKEYFGFDI